MKILKFQATWCQPCKMLSKTLAGVDLGVEVAEIDIDENPDMATKYGIKGVPTMVLVNEDTPVSSFVGLGTESKIRQWVQDNRSL